MPYEIFTRESQKVLDDVMFLSKEELCELWRNTEDGNAAHLASETAGITWMLLQCKRHLLEKDLCPEDGSFRFTSITMDDYDMLRAHTYNLTILRQARDAKVSNSRNLMPPTAPFNSNHKHDYNVLTTSSILVKRTTYRRDSDSDISEDHASIILKLKDLCRKLSLNVKPAALSRKSANDGSNKPLLNSADKSSEIMGSIFNQSPRFNASKTSEDEMNNNNCT